MIWLRPGAGETEVAHASQFLHFGNNLKPGTREDRGLDGCVGNPQALHGWLAMIAREAMDMGLLPGLQHPAISLDDARAVWPSGGQDSAGADLAALVDYPFNGLFPHPLSGDTRAGEGIAGSSAA